VPLETPLFEKPTTQNEGVTRIALLKIEVSRGALKCNFNTRSIFITLLIQDYSYNGLIAQNSRKLLESEVLTP